MDAKVEGIGGGHLHQVAMGLKAPRDRAVRPIERDELSVVDPHIDPVDIHGRRGLRGGIVPDGEGRGLPDEDKTGPEARTRR